MKKLITMLLLTTIAFSQKQTYNDCGTYISASADFRNAIIGSNPTNNKPELDLLIRAGAISNKNLLIGMIYERFKAIEYNKYAVEIGQRIGENKLQFTPTLEFGWIERYSMNSWTIGANLYITYNLNEKFAILVTNNLQWRTDLNELYGGDNWRPNFAIGVEYKFN